MISCFLYLLASCVGSEGYRIATGVRGLYHRDYTEYTIQTPSNAPRPFRLCFSPILKLQAEREQHPAGIGFFFL